MDIHELAEKISEKMVNLFLTDPTYYSQTTYELAWLSYDDNIGTIKITCEPYIFEAVLKEAITEVLKNENKSREKVGKLDEEDHRESDADGQSGSQKGCQFQPADHVIKHFLPHPAGTSWDYPFKPNSYVRATKFEGCFDRVYCRRCCSSQFPHNL